jgi:membrane protease YdiL (CAAX protease family)
MFWLGNLSEWLGVIAVVMIAGVSPLLKKIRLLEFRYPQREANFAFSMFALINVFAYLYFSNPIFSFLRVASNNFAGGEVAQRMLLAVICLLPFIVALIARGQPLKSVGWGRENLRAGLTVGLMLGILTIFLRGKFLTILAGITPQQASMLLVYLILAFAEETIFRGYIQPRLQSRIGQRWGWLATAALFTLWQLPGRIYILPFVSYWPVLVISLIQGLILGWIMQKSGHVLAPMLYRALSAWMIVF